MRSTIALRGSTLGIVSVLLGASNATAHHSFAPHFDRSRSLNISGTVKEYEARNPHSYLHVNAVDENGRTREYVCESHGVTQLSRIGITPQLLKAGQKYALPVPSRGTVRTCVSSRPSSWRTAAS